jgi:hypothetical protein
MRPKLKAHQDSSATNLLKKVIKEIVDDMKFRIGNGEPGPEDLNYEDVYHHIVNGVAIIRLSNTNPPRPEIVVSP